MDQPMRFDRDNLARARQYGQSDKNRPIRSLCFGLALDDVRTVSLCQLGAARSYIGQTQPDVTSMQIAHQHLKVG
ncbi:hypothetical protein PHIN109289_04000 [Phaeobacter inhibens]|nr:hypothetical protein PhaeoP51_01727 [Phaeobacter inhibens]AUQ82617.1 hypothetical protein PhaeoP57_01687 [Phaeobacter inhibens]AUQ90378.1 hypothetical protein PhaeoP24_01761 [Phaeobacter inhibens]AUR07904.1 hypothetical protein PhaeoP59_01730 [Phaeobacter inhibens]AUR11743.1 hypothetical protein PhaeoP48_01756 [Phaeobacter inhibens]